MFDEKELSKIFGASDEGFRNNFNNVLAKLQTEESPRRVRKMCLNIAVIVFVVCAALTGTAYAVEKIFVDRADIGAKWVLVSAPEDYYESGDSVMFMPIYSVDVTADEQPYVDAGTAQILHGLLEGMVFTAAGEPIEIMASVPDSDEYRIVTGDGVLYNKEGEELRSIYYRTVGYSEPLDIWIWTKAEYEAQREAERKGIDGIKLTDDYEEAAHLLGSDFCLPGVYTAGLDSPEFRYQETKYGTEAGRKAVYVTYRGTPGIYYFAEAMRSEDEVPNEWYADGAVIEQCEIKGTTVYKASAKDIIRYTWTHDGIVYMIFQNYSPNEFTDEQIVEIIVSMIR